METERKKVLFVDDEAAILEAYERMLELEDNGWACFFAGSVNDALVVAARHDLDVVVTDVKMPERDGFDLLRALGADEHTRTVPTIVVTADSEPTLKRRAIDLGAADLLRKPLCREDLLARIHSVLRLKSYQDQIAEQVRTLDCKVRERTSELEESRREILWRLAKAGEYRDDQTGNHVVRVACYSRAIAHALNLDAEFVENLFPTSALHDVGKIGIPDSILLKPGPLTPNERQVMQDHCLIGVGILTGTPKLKVEVQKRHNGISGAVASGSALLEMAVSVAKCHHEKWNGSGYPEGLIGTAIPVEARIVALADVFDALTTERPYKPAFPVETALEMIRGERGRHFDPQVTDAFEANRAAVDAIYAEFGGHTAVLDAQASLT